MNYIKPLHFGEDGYDETDIRVRGLPLLTVDVGTLHRLPRQLQLFEILSPIYVVRKEHFLTKCIRFREGQNYIFGEVDSANRINDNSHIHSGNFVVSTFNEFNLKGMYVSIFIFGVLCIVLIT